LFVFVPIFAVHSVGSADSSLSLSTDSSNQSLRLLSNSTPSTL
jgi:hypothetical protein